MIYYLADIYITTSIMENTYLKSDANIGKLLTPGNFSKFPI